MALARSAPFLLAAFGLYLGLFLDTVEMASEERMTFFRNLAEAYDSQSPSQREKTLFLKSMGSGSAASARSKRATESCRSGPITASMLEDPLFIVRYDSIEQFDACLSEEVLEAHLALLFDHPLPDDYLAVIKRKLDEIYPDGIPDDQLKQLSYLSRMYSPEEISTWRLSSSDTLATLLSPDNGAWKPDQLKQLILTYTELGGTLTGPLLNALGGRNLCLLGAGQLRQISPESVRHAEKLDVSSCSQDKKDILYEKARVAFESQEGTSAYYPLIQPYLGGAPVDDLRKLARSQAAMDINTFVNLKPEELKKLSVRDVKDLLGVHLPDLKDAESHPSVATWIKSHLQSELDTLGIGLQGGVTAPSPSSTAAGPLTIPAVVSALSAVSVATVSDADAATFSSVPRTAATDSYTTPLFRVPPAADETSSLVETTSPAAVPAATIAASNVSATSEGASSGGGSPVPTAATDTDLAATGTTAAPRNITTKGTVLEDGRGVNTTASVNAVTVSTSVTADGTLLPTVATHVDATASVNATVVSAVTTDGTIVPVIATPIDAATSVNTAAASASVTADGIAVTAVASHIDTTAFVNATAASASITTGGTVVLTAATQANTTASVNATAASASVTTGRTVVLTAATHANTTASVNATAASTNVTTNGIAVAPVATHLNTAPSVTATAASPNVTTEGAVLPSVASKVNVTSAPNATASRTPTLHFSRTSAAPHVAVTTSPERLPAPPAPLPNATVPASLGTSPVTSGRMPAASTRNAVPSSETLRETPASPGPGQPRPTVVVPPERGTTSRAPPKTKPPPHPTPNGYIHVRPLSAPASSPSLSCLLLMPSVAVGLSALRKFF